MNAQIPRRLMAAAITVLLAIPLVPASPAAAAETTTTTVGSSANPSVYGQSVTFTASVTPSAASGTVTFRDGATSLGTGDLASGTATYSTSSLSVAGSPHSITAVYDGDSTYEISLSSVLSQGVDPASTTTSLTSSLNPSAFGQSVIFTATVTTTLPGSGIPTGTVQWNVDGVGSGSPVALDASGQATLSTSALTVGSHTIDAAYGGDASFVASNATQWSQTVAKDNQTITFNPLANRTLGDSPVSVSATASSGLTVTFSSTTPSVCTVAGTVVTLLTTGTCWIDADQAGDSTWSAAPRVKRSFTIGTTAAPPSTTVPTLTVTADSKSRPFGVANPTFTAVISGFVNGQGLATSGVTGSPACSTTATLVSPAGTYPITCSIGTLTSSAYSFVFAPATLTIVRGASSVTLSTTTTVFETSAPVTWTAAVEPGITSAVPSGSLLFTIDGVAEPVVALDASGRGSLTVIWTTPGVKSVEVAYTGDGSFAASGTASAAPAVVTNTARATGVGVSATTFYPIVDSWRDTVTARGIRSERLTLGIDVKSARGIVVRRYSAGPAAGAYAWAWNGRTSKGALVPDGRYTIVQTLTDPYGSRPRRTVTSTVAVSLRRIQWTTKTITAGPGPRCFQFSTGDEVGPHSCSSTAPLPLAGNAGHWPGVGYEFRLPSATAYRSLRVEVQGTSTGGRPTIGFHDWKLSGQWGELYRADWARTAISPAATRWSGVATSDIARYVSGRSVRAYVDGGGRLGGAFAFEMTRVRLIVSVGTLQ